MQRILRKKSGVISRSVSLGLLTPTLGVARVDFKRSFGTFEEGRCILKMNDRPFRQSSTPALRVEDPRTSSLTRDMTAEKRECGVWVGILLIAIHRFW